MKHLTTALATTALLAVPVLTASPAAAVGKSELAEVRAATAKYHDVEAAEADGYIDTEICVPGMGIHYVRPDLLDAHLDATAPELLVYAPRSNGRLKLVAVEYGYEEYLDTGGYVQDAELFGQPFDETEGFGPHYPTLHAWIWQANPDGTFAKHNPNVSCD